MKWVETSVRVDVCHKDYSTTEKEELIDSSAVVCSLKTLALSNRQEAELEGAKMRCRGFHCE